MIVSAINDKFEQSCYERSHYIVFSFLPKKNRPKTNIEKCYQCSVSIEISLDLKVFLSSNVKET